MMNTGGWMNGGMLIWIVIAVVVAVLLIAMMNKRSNR